MKVLPPHSRAVISCQQSCISFVLTVNKVNAELQLTEVLLKYS